VRRLVVTDDISDQRPAQKRGGEHPRGHAIAVPVIVIVTAVVPVIVIIPVVVSIILVVPVIISIIVKTIVVSVIIVETIVVSVIVETIVVSVMIVETIVVPIIIVETSIVETIADSIVIVGSAIIIEAIIVSIIFVETIVVPLNFVKTFRKTLFLTKIQFLSIVRVVSLSVILHLGPSGLIQGRNRHRKLTHPRGDDGSNDAAISGNPDVEGSSGLRPRWDVHLHEGWLGLLRRGSGTRRARRGGGLLRRRCEVAVLLGPRGRRD